MKKSINDENIQKREDENFIKKGNKTSICIKRDIKNKRKYVKKRD